MQLICSIDLVHMKIHENIHIYAYTQEIHTSCMGWAWAGLWAMGRCGPGSQAAAQIDFCIFVYIHVYQIFALINPHQNHAQSDPTLGRGGGPQEIRPQSDLRC